ncbi:hypothetical protein [Curtobacterium sp. Leaf261]|uniref:hypothetical protein n=1 Tax=Curtobacterium sp. Leaf261 TaxID=1736311 RepID=UPI0007001992|nr:hypothetical protein [Curtobacterium sp. Leaf261]KQO62805.1 hypothetical protein ASF23_07650 [Curtobacterium sp. Leaf261]
MAEDLAGVARRLLAVRPEDFVAARTAAVRDARAVDRDRAGLIGALRKPAPAAWVIDLLAAEGALDDAVDLGPRLRDAQAGADPRAIRGLRTERRALVESLVQTGAELAEDAGHVVTAAVRAQVAATIEAGMADPWAGTAIRSGLLVRPLESVGFDRVDLGGAIAVPGAVDLPAPDDDASDDDGPDDDASDDDAPDDDAPADDAPAVPDPPRGGRGRSTGASRASRPDAGGRAPTSAADRTTDRAARQERDSERAARRRRDADRAARAEQERVDGERRERLARADRDETTARSRAEAADAAAADLERQLRAAVGAANAAHADLAAAVAAREELTDG